MKRTRDYIGGFFDTELNGGALVGAGYLRVALDDFLENETKENAFAVYNSFFDCFRVHLEGASFVDLLDALLAYEEHSSVLLEKQRDHLVHSVNVFILGLSIYARNAAFREAFAGARSRTYNGARASVSEEFLYRWGLAALLHDIGYPVEIIHNQFRSFISFIGEADGNRGAKPFLDYLDFSILDSISEVLYKSAFTGGFTKDLPADVELDPLRPTHLIACNLHTTLGVPFAAARDAVTGFLAAMQKNGFVDHGFYSAIILLKWYGHLIQRSGLPADMLYHPVLDSAGAIFLHNYYRNGLMKPPFSLGPLTASSHPVGFLLILCDELQEWNRMAYGSKDKKRVLAATGELEIGDEEMSLYYRTFSGVMADSFGDEKAGLLNRTLALHDVFPRGLSLTQTTSSEQYLEDILANDKIMARPLLKNLEAMAKIIHENYNKKREADGKPIEYAGWGDMPDTLRYSNIRQARGVYAKLAMCGLFVSEEPIETSQEVTGFSPEQVERLAREEHDEWVAERLSNGWTHGERDAVKKTNPYLIPYTALSEEIKDYDRDAVRNIFPMLKQLGLRVYAVR